MLSKIISGGQTGADMGGLIAARSHSLKTGGRAPRRFMTENGQQKELLESYGLVETTNESYSIRTRLNVQHSDGTVIYGNVASPGSKATLKFAVQMQKPHLVNPTSWELAKWIQQHKISVLNVAGNRESHNPGIELKVSITVGAAITMDRDGIVG